MSARMPFTSLGLAVGLLIALLLAKAFHDRQAFAARAFENLFHPCRVLLHQGARTDQAVFLIQIVLMIAVIALDHCDLLEGQRWNPTGDFLVGTAFLKIRDQVLDRNAARRKLK